MVKLLESASAQTVRFIGRSLATGAANAFFTDEAENRTYQYSVDLESDGYHTAFTVAMPDLKQDRGYSLVVSQSSSELYRGKVFVTNQSGYSINSGRYLERTSENTYLTCE